MASSKDTVKETIDIALREDLYRYDATTIAVVPENASTIASIIAKENLVVAGLYITRQVFKTVDKNINFVLFAKDGQFLKKGSLVAKVKGMAHSILKAERTALNFLCHLSGVATETNKYVKVLAGSGVRILDTRKTLPGLRLLEKYAVRMGGGYNHRFSLAEQILIKDNHLKFATAKNACEKATRMFSSKLIEVEVDNLKDFKSLLKSSVNVIMLDNMKVVDIKKAVNLRNKVNKSVLLEASGLISLKNIRSIAETGVDFVSIGAITHSAKYVDFSLEIEKKRR